MNKMEEELTAIVRQKKIYMKLLETEEDDRKKGDLLEKIRTLSDYEEELISDLGFKDETLY